MSNIKLNFNKPVLLIGGTQDENAKLNVIVGNVLAQETSEDEHRIGKIFSWIVSVGDGKEILMDSSDLKAFKELILKSKQVSAFFKAQILNVIDEAKEASEKPAKKAKKSSSDSEDDKGGRPHPKDNPFHP